MIIDRNAVTQEVPIDPETGKPYLNTVAAIQVSANGVGSEVSPYVAQAVEVIRESGLPGNQRPVHQRGRRSGRRAQGGR